MLAWLLAAGVAAVVVAVLVGRRLAPEIDGLPQSHRHRALDGLRGFLAFLVFLYHARIWYGFVHKAGWKVPADEPWRHFGDTSVALFFMVTAFLFVGRLIETRDTGLDWRRLFVARVLRLTPAYWVAMALMFSFIAIAGVFGIDGVGTAIVNRTWPEILSAAAVWLGFCMLGLPTLDGYWSTPTVTAGVTWTLPYEWTFYLLLPLLALFLHGPRRVPGWAVGVGLVGALWVGIACVPDMFDVPTIPLLPWRPATAFLGGIAAAVLCRLEPVRRHAGTRAAGVLAAVALAAAYLWPGMATDAGAVALMSIGFTLVAGGNDLGGLLTSAGARFLGHVSYSVYLLHGLVLWGLFMLVIGRANVESWPEAVYWAVVALGVTPLVVVLATLNFRWVEWPAMQWAGRLGRKSRTIASSPAAATDLAP